MRHEPDFVVKGEWVDPAPCEIHGPRSHPFGFDAWHVVVGRRVLIFRNKEVAEQYDWESDDNGTLWSEMLRAWRGDAESGVDVPSDVKTEWPLITFDTSRNYTDWTLDGKSVTLTGSPSVAGVMVAGPPEVQFPMASLALANDILAGAVPLTRLGQFPGLETLLHEYGWSLDAIRAVFVQPVSPLVSVCEPTAQEKRDAAALRAIKANDL